MFSASNRSRRAVIAPTLLAGFILGILAVPGPAAADDRDLLRTSSTKPYVFILLDTSGSMNWTPPCTQAQFDANQCHTLCTLRDCFADMQADDTDSKAYIARQALYEVLQGLTDINFGFATYNQDDLTIAGKEFFYVAGTGGVTLPGSGPTPSTVFPAPGAQEVFGKIFTCDTGTGDEEIGCAGATPADLNDGWELTRVQRLPKGGAKFDTAQIFYIRWAGTIYKATYTPVGTPTPGATTISISVRVDKCNSSGGSCTTNINTKTVTFTRRTTNGTQDEFIGWSVGPANRTSSSSNPTVDYYDGGDTQSDANTTCGGWDSNFDTSSDPGPDHNSTPNADLRFITDITDTRGGAYYLGDVIPFDWKTDHKIDIQRRLAPNLVTNPTGTPDFRVSTYFKDIPNSGESFLRLKDTAVRPLISSGSTPLGNSMEAFRKWYANGCSSVSSCGATYSSWKGTAAAQDKDWGCRTKYLLVITDGDDTCYSSSNSSTFNPCSVATALRNENFVTYVVGLGLAQGSGNYLTCMASNGGSHTPFYPQNKDELVDKLLAVFGQIKEQASSFASAAVPTVQTEAADKIYISNFTPLNETSLWNGHVDAYLKPLPLTNAGLPDRGRDCGSTRKSACHLWDAADQVTLQAPNMDSVTTIDASTLRLGLGDTQRRVFYAKAVSGTTTPRNLRLFSPPTGPAATDPDWSDLFAGYFKGVTPPAVIADQVTAVAGSMKELLRIRHATINQGSTTTNIDFVLGDTFHADPILVDRPNDFGRYVGNLYANAAACADDPVTSRPNNPGYKCWADKQQFRRKLLAIGADDGQVHFFDAGIFHVGTGKFDNGTGRELFSYIPRLALPIVREQAPAQPAPPTPPRVVPHVFGMDSTPRVQEVFIDPANNGTTPTVADRQWRTVAIGGFREGGRPLGSTGRVAGFESGYYAIDITQPDTLDTTFHPSTALIPSCLTLGNTASAVPSGCGQVPFPALLWEFTDSLLTSRLDEEGNLAVGTAGRGTPDLGQTWSVPVVGRIKIKNASNVVEERWVAIFGGGMDGDNKTDPTTLLPKPQTGTYVYIVDVETGKVLYKQKVTGAVPADPAVIDKNNDGVLDTIYIGTTLGFLYRIDMSTPVQLQNVTLATSQGIPAFATSQTVQRITDATWLPVPIFDTGGKPIYHGAVSIYLASLNLYGLAFGTGDREDLWALNNQEGRFYFIVDQGFGSAQNESNYTQILPDGGTTTADLVSGATAPTGKNRGWYMRLDPNERVIAKAFGMTGLIFFSTYVPEPPVVDANGLCSRTGTSFAYTVYGKNANPLLHQDPNNLSSALVRYQQVSIFLAPPTVDMGTTKNPNDPDNPKVVTLTAAQADIMKNLMTFFPKGARFGNLFYTLSAMGSDTRYVGIAAIPIGLIERNWRVVQ